MRLILALLVLSAASAFAGDAPAIAIDKGTATVTFTIDVSAECTALKAKISAAPEKDRAALKAQAETALKSVILQRVYAATMRANNALRMTDEQIEAQALKAAQEANALRTARPSGTVDVTK